MKTRIFLFSVAIFMLLCTSCSSWDLPYIEPVSTRVDSCAASRTLGNAIWYDFPQTLVLPNNKILIIGGNTDGNAYSGEDIHLYHWDKDSFIANYVETVSAGAGLKTDVGQTLTKISNSYALLIGGLAADNGNATSAKTAQIVRFNLIGYVLEPLNDELHHARRYHTATMLTDDTHILVAGGIGNNLTERLPLELITISESDILEIETLGYLPSLRNHTATLLPNGNVLIAGGSIQTASSVVATDSAWVYITAQKSIERLKMPQARKNHTSTLLPEIGKVLIAGGFDADGAALNSAYLYSPNSNGFSAIASLNYARANHTTNYLADATCQVFIVGGENESGVEIGQTEIFDTESLDFFVPEKLELASKRTTHAAVQVSDTSFLLIGGKRTENEKAELVWSSPH